MAREEKRSVDRGDPYPVQYAEHKENDQSIFNLGDDKLASFISRDQYSDFKFKDIENLDDSSMLRNLEHLQYLRDKDARDRHQASQQSRHSSN